MMMMMMDVTHLLTMPHAAGNKGLNPLAKLNPLNLVKTYDQGICL